MLGKVFFIFILTTSTVAAADIGDVSQTIGSSFPHLAKLITSGSYIAGLAFSIAVIIKFKAHKDNPTQVPIGLPITLAIIAASLLFLPSILSASGETIFGNKKETAGPKGIVWCPNPPAIYDDRDQCQSL